MKKRKIYAWIGLVLLGLIGLWYASSEQLNTVHYTIGSNQAGDITIALVTDLHSCDYGPEQRELLDEIDRAKPDMVLLGGDIIDDVLPQAPAKTVLKYLGENYPTYYVTGNHEFWTGDIDEIKRLVQSFGIPVLEGDSKTLEVAGQTVTISGIDDPEVGDWEHERQLKRVTSLQTEDLHILLAHRPEMIEDYLPGDFDLILSGHAHGGQWRLPGLMNGLLAPDQGFFPKYAGGRYDFEDTTFIVSRGLARESTRVPRLFNRPELVIITVNQVKETALNR